MAATLVAPPPPPVVPAVQAAVLVPQPVRAEAIVDSSEQDRWASQIPALCEPQFADLLRALAMSSPAGDAQTLRSLLCVYFQMEWAAAGDVLVELAYRAGEQICRLIISQPGIEHGKLMALGCRLLNTHRQFAEQFQCISLPAYTGFDHRLCETPLGQRREGNNVTPLSFYVVTRRTGQPCRRAKVQWVA